ncbi:D-galacturonic acid reductase [Mycena rebaudengoi]|nr:D-galacturonic acid reductase [Mycena rebaudengoi]
MADLSKLNVLMCNITYAAKKGEYTTGWVGTGASKSDKKGNSPAIRQHLAENIGGVYKDMDLSFDEFPERGKVDPEAYKTAIDKLSPGDAVIIFTPDCELIVTILMFMNRGLTYFYLFHILLKNHVGFVEHHKRFDPAYSDAKARAASLGEFNFFSAWMSQPKSQLETFRAWAGKDSDISYYLSSHHIDICCWILQDYRDPDPPSPYNCVPQTEDTITLMVDWQSIKSPKHKGTGVYTASWTAPLKAGVHSAQALGDITLDQAHRGYDVTVDDTGKQWYNPFYMKYSPSESGHFDGQRGYGYISIEKFVDAARSVNGGLSKPTDYDTHGLPTIANTVLTTAILNAGRISLDEKRPVGIKKDGEQWILE